MRTVNPVASTLYPSRSDFNMRVAVQAEGCSPEVAAGGTQQRAGWSSTRKGNSLQVKFAHTLQTSNLQACRQATSEHVSRVKHLHVNFVLFQQSQKLKEWLVECQAVLLY